MRAPAPSDSPVRALLVSGMFLLTVPSAALSQQVRDSAGVRVVRYAANARPRAVWTLNPVRCAKSVARVEKDRRSLRR